MFDAYIISDDGFRNVSKDGKVIGFEYKARLNYYRGIPLSMVDKYELKVNNEPIDRSKIKFSVGEDWFTLDEMETVTKVKWEFGETASVFVEQDGGLPQGAHDLSVEQVLRIAYFPFPLRATITKTLELVG
ncbi:hypothetical protein DFQ01_104301 [Paenibacillus cellulosilyticus]|uniref:C-deglycosylation enzyme beta subunit n=1 Tax=Paenibacillus cellulosilyticus TaxID=375489 RepID=A0A2V2Z5I0_9BACL|nr:DUF6379 domain-containing protein [Paenibacillus cellulosilyticus]PWW05739.1 hypothetical protein DFQ01_104301 [Paenibacillus cellulosilyticus]QKS45249.1 hypothetical protein HUB94_13100 [Paenibacillus cellulosilyticus]